MQHVTSHENFSRITDPLCRQTTGDRWVAQGQKCFIFFGVSLSKLLSKLSSCRWFQTPWRSCDVAVIDTRSLPGGNITPDIDITMTSHECHEVSNHRPLECLFNTLFRLTTTKYQRPTAPTICQGNRPVTGRFPSLMASNVETCWRHQMETFSSSLAICTGNTQVPGEFPAQRPVTRSFDVFFDLRLNKRLGNQPNWNSHTQKIVNKISRTLGVMNRLKRYLPISAMKLMYDSLILSHLKFGITNWGFEWDRISKLQKRALRIMTNSKYNAHTEPLFKQLHLLKVKDIFDVQCLKFWYKFVNKKLPNYFRDMFEYNYELHEIGTRSHDQLHLYPTRTSGARNDITYRNYWINSQNIWQGESRPIAYILSFIISNVTWLICIIIIVPLSIAIFATIITEWQID